MIKGLFPPYLSLSKHTLSFTLNYSKKTNHRLIFIDFDHNLIFYPSVSQGKIGTFPAVSTTINMMKVLNFVIFVRRLYEIGSSKTLTVSNKLASTEQLTVPYVLHY